MWVCALSVKMSDTLNALSPASQLPMLFEWETAVLFTQSWLPERRQWEGNAALQKSAHCLSNFQLHHGLHLSFVFVDYILPSFMFLCEHWNSTEHKRGWVLKFPSLHPDSASARTSKSVVRADRQSDRQTDSLFELSHIKQRYTPDCVSYNKYVFPWRRDFR